MKPRLLTLSDIRLDGGTQSRVEINEDVVADYAEMADLPPVVVFYDSTDYWLADGFHRYMAASRNQQKQIEVEVRTGTRRDAILYSLGANASHGLRRTNEDKRKAVTTLLKDQEWSKWSNAEIARKCCVSHTLVNNVRSSLETVSSEDSETRVYTTKHGTESTMNTADIGVTPDVGRVGNCHGRQNSTADPALSSDTPAWEQEPSPIIRDSKNQPIDQSKLPKIYLAFQYTEDIRQVANELGAIKRRIEAIIKAGALAHSNPTTITGPLQNAIKAIKHGRPHVLCPACNGHGKCRACGDFGWITEDMLRRMPEDMR